MTVKQKKIYDRYAGVQTFLTEGCLFLSLCTIAEEVTGLSVSILHMVKVAKEKGWIDGNNDMTEWGQCQLLESLTGMKWSRQAREVGSVVADNEYTVEKWKWQGRTHFRRRYVDTLTNSQTVKNGKLECWYVYIKEI